MRKGKIVIKKIEDKIRRQVTFAKRRKSLIKKAHELSVLCDVSLGLIIFSYSNKLYDFCSNSTSMENLIMRYQKEKEAGHTSADHSFHPACSNCAKMKESMMREIENLKMNLQLYDGHGLNLLTYNELLQFELHLESSLQHARARKCEFMQQQQQQTNKVKGKGKETFMDDETQDFPDRGQGGSSWEHLMWQAERHKMTYQRQDDDDVTRLQLQVKEEFLFDGEKEPTGALQLVQLPQPSSQQAPNQGPYDTTTVVAHLSVRRNQVNIKIPMNREKTQRLPSRPTANSTQSEVTGNQIGEPNPNLPERLLAVDYYPDGARLNIYSRPEYLGTIASLLKGSKEWERIRSSQFGKLFEFPVARCSHSGKLIHGLLSRQLVTEKKHELWFVFGGYPMRFSIREFHIVTGLRCGELPTQDEIDKHKDQYLSVWDRLFGKKSMVTVGDVIEMLLTNDKTKEKRKQFSSWKKLCLALIVIVDGVVVCHDQSFVSPDFVEMLNDIDFFLDYPWGRKAFLATIRRFGPPKDAPNPIGILKKRLKQKTSACYGFPLALQLQALQSIPVILERIKDPTDLRNFTERSAEGLSFAVLLHETDILDAEVDDKLLVAHTLAPKGTLNESELVWETEVSDPKVDFILKLINEGHIFKPFEWPLLKAANQEVNIPEKDGDDIPEDPTEVNQSRSKKPILDKAKPKPLTRCSMKEKEVVKLPTIHKHTSQKKPTAKVHVGGESNDPGYITLAHLDDMKEWILKQNEDLRNKVREDVTEIVGPKSHSQEDTPAGRASNLHRSNRLNTNCMEKMAKTDAPPKETRKRKRVEIHSISTRSVSAGDIEGGDDVQSLRKECMVAGEDVQFLGTQAREGGEDVQSTWNEDGNAQSPGTFDQYDDYGDALKIIQEGDSDHCPNCVETKESMMREIENLKLSLQLYEGHGLNSLNYDELLRFELQLESSLYNARARKSEFMRQQQQQTDKHKGKGKEILMDEESTHFSNPVRGLVCQRQEGDDIMHRQVKKEFPSYGEEPTGVLHLLQPSQPAPRLGSN